MDSAELQRQTDIINNLSHEEMCCQWRFSKGGECPYFNSHLPLWPTWEARFKAFGGFTSEISKRIGWDE
jgi:hypothetical protein